jgi:serine/threonine protein kinase
VNAFNSFTLQHSSPALPTQLQGHLNIVSADDVLLTKTHLGLVMEYVPGECCHPSASFEKQHQSSVYAAGRAGGNMVGYVTKKRETKHERGGLCLDEDEARYYFLQLLSAVEYCHKNHVAHRHVLPSSLSRPSSLCAPGQLLLLLLAAETSSLTTPC